MGSKDIDLNPRFRELRKLLERGDRFLLTGHVRADGDCLGAQTALFHLIQSMGKKATILNPDPVSPRYAFLEENTPFQAFDPSKKESQIPPHDVLFVLDINSLDRTGGLADFFRSGTGKKVIFDHHVPTDAESWDLEIVDPSAAATGVLVYRFAKAEGLSLSPAAAQGVFLSIVTDTGWFKYSNTDAEAFRVASELVVSGIDPSIIFQHVYQQRSIGWTQGLRSSLESVRFEAEGRLAVATLPQGLDREAAMELSDSEEILDILRAVGRVEVVALFRKEEGNKVKVSLRSKGDFNVNRFARRYGGGGHRRASGLEVEGTLSEVSPKITSELVKAIFSTKGDLS